MYSKPDTVVWTETAQFNKPSLPCHYALHLTMCRSFVLFCFVCCDCISSFACNVYAVLTAWFVWFSPVHQAITMFKTVLSRARATAPEVFAIFFNYIVESRRLICGIRRHNQLGAQESKLKLPLKCICNANDSETQSTKPHGLLDPSFSAKDAVRIRFMLSRLRFAFFFVCLFVFCQQKL